MSKRERALTLMRLAMKKALPSATNWWTTYGGGYDYVIGMTMEGQHYDVYVIQDIKSVIYYMGKPEDIPLFLAKGRDPFDEVPFPVDPLMVTLHYMLEV